MKSYWKKIWNELKIISKSYLSLFQLDSNVLASIIFILTCMKMQKQSESINFNSINWLHSNYKYIQSNAKLDSDKEIIYPPLCSPIK